MLKLVRAALKLVLGTALTGILLLAAFLAGGIVATVCHDILGLPPALTTPFAWLAVLATLSISASTALRLLRTKGANGANPTESGRSGEGPGEDLGRLSQQLYRQAQRMEERIETLETLMLEQPSSGRQVRRDKEIA